MDRPAIVVDPYSAAREYGPAFRARGVPTVAVLSTPAPLPAFAAAWHPEDFDRTVCFDGDLDRLAARLAAERPVCVVPGIESGVELAEALGERLRPGEGNTPGSTAARRDKWRMAQAVRAAGVPALRQVCTDDPAQVADWLAETGLAGARLVVKPPKSGGTEDVHVVAAGADWRPYFDRLLGAPNRFGARNAAVLVQEFAAGTEYVVDTYSVAGRLGIAQVCRYAKRACGDRLGIYQSTEVVPPDHPHVPVLADYVRRVADAVGLRNGCGHAEVMLTPDGPRLVEIAARLAGNPLPLTCRLATGDSQVDRTLRHRLDGTFTPDYRLERHARIVCLSAARAGRLENAELLAAAAGLGTAQAVHLPHHTGEVVPATTDLFTSLGWVVLADPDQTAVAADHDRLRELERQLVISPTGSTGEPLSR
ncbi:MAG TPA: ATP-grasp domain-containing protein [Mycobacteriales bacterium]|nr:ATP-grasp domain-containing protein [Mycobacteriales bacterium]